MNPARHLFNWITDWHNVSVLWVVLLMAMGYFILDSRNQTEKTLDALREREDRAGQRIQVLLEQIEMNREQLHTNRGEIQALAAENARLSEDVRTMIVTLQQKNLPVPSPDKRVDLPQETLSPSVVVPTTWPPSVTTTIPDVPSTTRRPAIGCLPVFTNICI